MGFVFYLVIMMIHAKHFDVMVCYYSTMSCIFMAWFFTYQC